MKRDLIEIVFFLAQILLCFRSQLLELLEFDREVSIVKNYLLHQIQSYESHYKLVL